MSRFDSMMADLRSPTATEAGRGLLSGMKRCLVPAVSAAMLLVGSNDLRAQGRVFYDDFEAGNADKWQGEYSRCPVATTAADGGTPHRGSYMAKCNWDGVNGTDQAEARSSLYLPPGGWRYTREFLIRAWFRYDANVDNVGGNKLMRMAGDYPKLSFYAAAQMDAAVKELFIYFEGIDGAQMPDGLTYNGGVAGDRKWHQLEIYVKDNTPGKLDGEVKVWVDDGLKLHVSSTKSVSSTAQWDHIVLNSNWSSNPGWEHDATNNAYWDDVEIYSDRATGATGSMSQGTIASSSTPATAPPAAPTAVRVIRAPDPQ